MEELRNYKLKGALIRSRWKNANLGVRPTKFFLNLENKNYISKHIRELKSGNTTIQNPEMILEEMRRFYESLFKEKRNINIEETSFDRIKEKLPKLSETENEDIEKDIMIEELGITVMKSKNNKSPGPDGYSNEFYKTFWHSIKMILLKLLNSYRSKNRLNPAELEGTITCIPKGGKVRHYFKNWRPITLNLQIFL